MAFLHITDYLYLYTNKSIGNSVFLAIHFVLTKVWESVSTHPDF